MGIRGFMEKPSGSSTEGMTTVQIMEHNPPLLEWSNLVGSDGNPCRKKISWRSSSK
jgi:hypothetical protein